MGEKKKLWRVIIRLLYPANAWAKYWEGAKYGVADMHTNSLWEILILFVHLCIPVYRILLSTKQICRIHVCSMNMANVSLAKNFGELLSFRLIHLNMGLIMQFIKSH